MLLRLRPSWCALLPRLAVAVFLLYAPAALAQEAAQDAERPRVERLRFEGAEALSPERLRGAIVTEATRCRATLLRPFCWITDWHVLYERHDLDRDELPRDALRLQLFYARRGYREARVESELRSRGEGVEVVFHIDEGEPTRIDDLELTQDVEVLSRGALRRAGLPRPGDPLDLVRLDTALAHLAARLGERGYLDAVIRDSVEVRRAGRRARIELRIEPRHRTTVGGIEIQGNERVDDGTILDALRLREGQVLRTSDLAASQRSLFESNLFHEARVSVATEPDSAKRLQIEVREAPPRSVRIGGGFNTIEFVQAEARFTHYNWLGGGRRLDLRGTIGNLLAPQLNGRGIFRDVLPSGGSVEDETPFRRPTWQASVELMQPAFRSAANTLGLSAFAHRRIVPGIAVDQGLGAELSLTRRLDYGVPATVSYRFERSSVEAGDLYFCVNFGICDLPTVDALRGHHTLSPLRLGFFMNRADDPIAPTRGYRARLDLEHASGPTGSDFRYHRASGEATYYRPLDVRRRRVLAGRIRAGWVRALSSTAGAVGVPAGEQALLHPRKRFYAGGARSVRGVGENQLGPRILTVDPTVLRGGDAGDGEEYACLPERDITTCDPNAEGIDPDAFEPRALGGSSVLEASVEYRFPVWGSLQGAVFVDGAIVGERPDALFDQGSGAVTPGFGVRFPTPVGPIRIDLGLRPTGTERLPVITESVGPDGERRLVRLEERRVYDPLAAAGDGFLRQTLARLTLHLSIGEAF